MTVTERARRLPPEVFDLPVDKMRDGKYTDAYFNQARDTLLGDSRHPNVVMQVFQKRHAYLGGMNEAIAILQLCSNDFSVIHRVRNQTVGPAGEDLVVDVHGLGNVFQAA